MSLAEIKSELKKLTPAEISEVEAVIEALKAEAAPLSVGGKASDFFGCARGTVIFQPGWDEPEPPEIWRAMRDDLPL